jgi:uncharacterized protein YjbI with pentapeptide repeats
MQKDSLLYKKFFASVNSDVELQEALRQDNQEIDELIKASLYPNQEAVYYTGRLYNSQDLHHFLTGDQHPLLLNQLEFAINKLKNWGINQDISNVDTLDFFFEKLKNPTEKTTILYADGKKSLEIITVLLENSSIDLDLRRTLFAEFLADDTLKKCVDGCFSKISSMAKDLQEHRDSANQMNRWIRNYATDVARKTAATRPFAMPESYQRLICRAIDVSIEANEIHASNYLLAQAKENQMPVAVTLDLGTLEIAHQIIKQNKEQIVNTYIRHLELEITTSGLVGFINTHLYEHCRLIIADPTKTYVEKISAIENKLKLLGNDAGFLLEEILDAELLKLKPPSAFSITVERRLGDKKWIAPIAKKSIEIGSKQIFYYNFPGNIDLAWFTIDDSATRYRFIDLLQESDMDLELFTRNQILSGLLKLPDFISQSNDLNTILTKNALSKLSVLLIPEERIAELLKESRDPYLFYNVMHKLPLTEGKSILAKIGKPILFSIFWNGFLQADVEKKFFELPKSYFNEHYNEIARNDALKVTNAFLKSLIYHEYLDFKHLVFYRLNHANYISRLDFSHADLRNSYFFQPIEHCNFDNAKLLYVTFADTLEDVSFINADLRNVDLRGDYKATKNVFRFARLSTDVFQAFTERGISNFDYADLREVDFQRLYKQKKMVLSLTHANLEETNLESLDLRQVDLYGANLKRAQLEYTSFEIGKLSSHIDVQGAKISLCALRSLYLAGVRQFDSCEISQDMALARFYPFTRLEKASFKKAIFLDNFFNVDMISCDLSDVKFLPLSITESEYNRLINVKFDRTKLVNSEFNHVRFESVSFFDCTLDNVRLLDVKIPSDALFNLYQHGHRDFNGVKELKGRIPERLPPFPLSEATLSKEAFIHLYRQGLRDFRASNLYGFYLSETLALNAISEVSLKLEGAKYKQSLLSCTIIPRTKRDIETSASSCHIHFLIQKPTPMGKNLISLEDIEFLKQRNEPNIKVLIQEVSLEHRPLVLLDNPREINFYWGYPPEDDALVRVLDFVQLSTRPTERQSSRLFFYLTQKFDSDQSIKFFAKNLLHLGYQHGQLNYYNKQGQLLGLDLNEKPIGVPLFPSTNNRFTSVLKTPEMDLPSKMSVEKPNRSRFYRIMADMGRRTKGMFRSGIKQGAHYELGFALMHFVSAGILSAKTPEIKTLTESTKEGLKRYAQQVVDTENQKKSASPYIRDLAWQVVVQCIDRGECSNQELVKADILDSLAEARPDIQVGYEYLWKKTKKLFTDLGEYLGEKFDDVVGTFQKIEDDKTYGLLRSTLAWHRLLRKLQGLISEDTAKTISKRKLYNWYEQPIVIRLIKDLESIFDEMGYVAVFEDFTEAELAGLLCDLWHSLFFCGISNRSEPQDILFLLSNHTFVHSVLNQDIRGLQIFLKANERTQDEVLLTNVTRGDFTMGNQEEVLEESVFNDRQKRSMGMTRAKDVLHGKVEGVATSAATRPTNWVNQFINAMQDPFFGQKEDFSTEGNHTFARQKRLVGAKVLYENIKGFVSNSAAHPKGWINWLGHYLKSFVSETKTKTEETDRTHYSADHVQHIQRMPVNSSRIVHTPVLLEIDGLKHELMQKGTFIPGQPLSLDTLNNSLLLVNFMVKVWNHYFSKNKAEPVWQDCLADRQRRLDMQKEFDHFRENPYPHEKNGGVHYAKCSANKSYYLSHFPFFKAQLEEQGESLEKPVCASRI